MKVNAMDSLSDHQKEQQGRFEMTIYHETIRGYCYNPNINSFYNSTSISYQKGTITATRKLPGVNKMAAHYHNS